jgi:hypothetical protein
MQVGEGLSPLHDLGRGRLGSGEGDMLGLLHDLLLSGETSAVGIRTNRVPHLHMKIVKCFSGGLKQSIAQFIKCNCSSNASIPFSSLDIWKELYWLIQRFFFSEVDGDIRQLIVKFSRHRIITFTPYKPAETTFLSEHVAPAFAHRIILFSLTQFQHLQKRGFRYFMVASL